MHELHALEAAAEEAAVAYPGADARAGFGPAGHEEEGDEEDIFGYGGDLGAPAYEEVHPTVAPPEGCAVPAGAADEERTEKRKLSEAGVTKESERDSACGRLCPPAAAKSPVEEAPTKRRRLRGKQPPSLAYSRPCLQP